MKRSGIPVQCSALLAGIFTFRWEHFRNFSG